VPEPTGTPPRRRRPALLIALAAVLVLVAGVLLVWQPWSGPDLTPRDLVVVPYQASVPEDWQATTETSNGTFTVLGPKDWSGLISGDEATVSQAETAATEDPESLVYLYVDASEGVYADTAEDAASQLAGSLPEGTRLVPQGEREVAGRAAVEVGGVVPLGESQLRLYAVALKEDPRALFVFACPTALYDEWRPTFDEIVDSVTYTG
jgi:hypothetical protein